MILFQSDKNMFKENVYYVFKNKSSFDAFVRTFDANKSIGNLIGLKTPFTVKARKLTYGNIFEIFVNSKILISENDQHNTYSPVLTLSEFKYFKEVSKPEAKNLELIEKDVDPIELNLAVFDEIVNKLREFKPELFTKQTEEVIRLIEFGFKIKN